MRNSLLFVVAAAWSLAGLEVASAQERRAARGENAAAQKQSGSVADDKARIRKSLSGMERVERDMYRKRLSLVNELGISGIGNDDAPKPGDDAPDFELMPLRFYDFQIDKTPITKENAGGLYAPVKLSSFRGKLPVVLIFGSYT